MRPPNPTHTPAVHPTIRAIAPTTLSGSHPTDHPAHSERLPLPAPALPTPHSAPVQIRPTTRPTACDATRTTTQPTSAPAPPTSRAVSNASQAIPHDNPEEVKMEMKRCSRCGETKPKSEFHRRPDRACGVLSHCKECARIKNRAGYVANVDHRRAVSRQWYHNNRERHRERAREWQKRQGPAFQAATLRRNELMRIFKLTEEAYDAMFKAQSGVCGICGEPPAKMNLAVDHDHSCCKGGKGARTCGKCIRGLLCSRCNRFLGWFEKYHEPARAYLEKRERDT